MSVLDERDGHRERAERRRGTFWPGLPAPTVKLISDVREAEARVRHVYSPVVAQILSEEMRVFVEVGARFGGTRHMEKLVADIMSRPLPDRSGLDEPRVDPGVEVADELPDRLGRVAGSV